MNPEGVVGGGVEERADSWFLSRAWSGLIPLICGLPDFSINTPAHTHILFHFRSPDLSLRGDAEYSTTLDIACVLFARNTD